MPPQYKILKARETDAAEILRLQYVAYQSEAALYNDFSIQPLTQTLEQALDVFHGSVILKAVVDDKIIGSVRATEQDDGSIYIGKLMVLPDYQNKGIGKRLLQTIENEFPNRRYWLITGHKSEKNLNLYEKHGYSRFKTEEAAPGLTFVYLEKYDLRKFMRETPYINFSEKNIQEKAAELFNGATDNIQKARIAYTFVRDEIPHTFDVCAKAIAAKASDVLEYRTGICHAKAVLLAALLRSQGIPTGFCFQHLTLMDDDSKGYCVHCYNAVWLEGHRVKLDARGNKEGVNAQFSLEEPILAYPCRPQYEEYHWPGIYADPHLETMAMLEQADSVEYIMENIPDRVTLPLDIEE